MVEANLMVERGMPSAEQSLSDTDEGALLVAALAAALVEYRREREHTGAVAGSTGANNRWRTLARWEQLRGRV